MALMHILSVTRNSLFSNHKPLYMWSSLQPLQGAGQQDLCMLPSKQHGVQSTRLC
jgi:hypothetical protein